MSEKERIFVFGASGHGKVVIDIIERQGLYQIAFLADDDERLHGSSFYGYRVLGGSSQLLASGVLKGVVAIGSNRARLAVAGRLTGCGVQLISAIHPSAQLGRGVSIGRGSVLMAGVVVNSDARIGDNVIVNSRASIDHDCSIGDGVHIAPGATLCGTVTIGAGTFICAGSTIIPNLRVGSNAVIGAGSLVIRDIPDQVTAVGSPAAILKKQV